MHSFGALSFATVTKGTPPNHLVLRPVGSYNHGHTILYIHVFFKSCYLRVFIPNSLKLGVELDPSLWNTDRSWHNLWDLSRKKLNA